MKKIIYLLIAFAAFAHTLKAQQIKRATLSSMGSTKVAAPIRISYTAGSCPGCNTLSKDGVGSVRQGFQQPPEIDNNPANCPPLTAKFNIVPIVTPNCGTKFDFEFTGIAATGATVEWDFGEGATPRRSTQLNPIGVSYATAGSKTIALTIRKGACSDAKAQPVTISASQIGLGVAISNIVGTKCTGDKTGSIKLAIVSGAGTKTFRWSNGATSQDLTNVAAGRYSVTATDGNGCTVVIDTAISQPNGALTVRDSIKKEECFGYADGFIALTLSGGTKPYAVKWSNGETTAKISDLAAKRYTVSISDSNSCKIDTAFTVDLRCKQDSSRKTGFLYDVITPNGDGLNDTWEVNKIFDYPNNQLIIYNRWGQAVYTVKPYKNTWDGTTDEGKELPAGAYYYLIKLNNDKQEVWSGSVTVIR
ncbi:MAG: gliding motility-associated C-terminal domain-containing protein [Saprospiraceae bacterium]|nr:gliding motility-associated C-terminal domain-containing protein [Saprospiraceae bacterium]